MSVDKLLIQQRMTNELLLQILEALHEIRDLNAKKKDTAFAETVLHLMKAAKLKQKDIAELAGVSQPTVNAWLRNGSIPHGPTYSRMIDLFVSYSIPINGLDSSGQDGSVEVGDG
jgi:DNA-binding transcriptional regulator YiaG